MVDIAKLAIEVDSSQATAAANNLNSLSQSSGKAEKSVKGVAKGSQDAGKAAQSSSYKYRMASMQLSQVASQGSVTGNYLQALAIQLPDLALGFGTVGILAGSLAGALAVPLFTALGATGKSVSDLSDEIDTLSASLEEADTGTYNLSKQMRELEQASRSAARLKISIDSAAAMSILDELNEAMAEEVGDVFEPMFLGIAGLEGLIRNSTLPSSYFEKYRHGVNLASGEISGLITAFRKANKAATPEAYEALASTVVALKDKYGDTHPAINELAENMANQIPAAIKASQTYARLNSVLDGTAKSATDVATIYEDDLSTAIDKSAMSLDEWLKQQEQASSQYQALLESMVTSNFNAEQKAAQALGMRAQKLQEFRDADIINDQEYKAALVLAEEEYAARIAAIKKKQQDVELGANKETLAAAGQFFGVMAQIAEKGGEEQFQTWKRMAQAQAAVSASLAIINALASAPPPLNIALAGVIGALGAVQIAQIEQQQYQARALGGQVKEGKRYLVGENGPEVVTMGSDGHIASNANSQQAQGNNFVFQISTGVSQTVKAELMSMMPMITKTAMQATRGRR